MRIALFGFTLIALLPQIAHANDAFFGTWSRGDGVVRAIIAPCGGNLCMTDSWVRPGVADEKVGDKVIFDVKPEGADTLKGSGYDPKRDLRFSVTLRVAGRPDDDQRLWPWRTGLQERDLDALSLTICAIGDRRATIAIPPMSPRPSLVPLAENQPQSPHRQKRHVRSVARA